MSRIRSVSSIERIPDDMRGMYLRHQPRGIVGRPDFANKSRKVALFIDGCFWHGCPRHYREPKSNVHFWRGKIIGNRRRDRKVNRILKSGGWKIIRVWECAL